MADNPHIEDGHLYIGDVRVNDIFDDLAHGHNAAYVFDFDHLNKHLAGIQQKIQKTGVPLTLFYAMKANPHPDILTTIFNNGFNIQASSLEEIHRVTKINNDPTRLSLNNDSLGTEVTQHAQTGTAFNFESLAQIKEFCSEKNEGDTLKPSHYKWGLRLRLPQEDFPKTEGILNTSDKYAHLGIPEEHWADAISLMQQSGKKIRTLHTHIGSSKQTSTAHLAVLERLLVIAEGIETVENINLGGGMGAAFHPNDTGFPLEEFCLKAKEILDRFEEKTGRKINIQAEPGEFLLAQSGYYLTKVARVNDENDGRKIILTGTALQAPLHKAHGQHLPIYTERDGTETMLAQIFGGTAHSGDAFGEHPLPISIKKGDVILIGNTGAYCTPESSYEGGTNFCLRPTPPLVAIENGEMREMKAPQASLKTANYSYA